MKSIIKKYKNICFSILFLLSIFVFIFTFRLLTRPAFSVVRNADCNIVEHTHSSECFKTCDAPGTTTLICGSYLGNNTISHIHDSFCYNQKNELICPIMEYEHLHSADCYDENMAVICGISYHQHSMDCLHIIKEDESFDLLCCGIPAHAHNESCYPAPPVTEEMPGETEDEIENEFDNETVPDNDADIIAEDDEYYYYDTPVPFAMFFMERSVDIDNSVILDNSNATAVFKYKDSNDVWITVTGGMDNIPANSPVRIEVNYKDIDRTEISTKNNQIVYQGIPSWLVVDRIGDIYNEDGDIVADLQVIGDNAVITFNQDYLDGLAGNTHLSGSFNIEGDVNWRELITSGTSPKLPLIDFDFSFENDLISKYGDFEVTKTGENKVTAVADENGKIHSYLEYKLKIKSNETDINVEHITITDTLSTENHLKIGDVINSPGYMGVTSQETTPGNSENGLAPYEEITGSVDSAHGKIQLENDSLKWTIDILKPGEERALVYYVELNEKYVGSGSAGILRNEAVPESNGFPREKVRHEFIPKANVSVNKSSCGVDLDSTGSGTLSYKIVVTADFQNSYAITNATVKDSFRWHMDEYVENDAEITVSITSNINNTTSTQTVDIQKGRFNLPIDRLEPGERLTITYSVPVKYVYAAGNKDFNFMNHASFVGDSDRNKLLYNHTFSGSDAYTYIYHNSWTRKMNGTTVDTARTIEFGANDKVLNYDKTTSSDNSFVVPKSAQEYIVIVNEDGTWDMSGAAFNDRFSDTRISYTGYLKIEEFDQIYDTGTNTNNIGDNALLSDLNNATPKQTVWVNINGQDSFNLTPTDYGLNPGNSVYRLTYYAAIKSDSSNIKNIVVSNSFNLTGTIGIGDDWFNLGGVGTTVQSTIIGSASYNIEKTALFHEKEVYKNQHGEIYWLIRAEGMLPENIHLQDKSGYNYKTTVPPDALVGAYLGDKDADLSGAKSYAELEEMLERDMTPYEISTRIYTYSLVAITSPSQLDGHEYAIFTNGDYYSGYMMDKSITDKMNCNYSDSAFVCQSEYQVNKKAQMWRFDLVETTTDQYGNSIYKFHVYYTDSSGNKNYLNINKQDNASISSTAMNLTINADNNKISITNDNGVALNFFGGSAKSKDYYSAYGYNYKDPNDWHYVAEKLPASEGDFSRGDDGSIYVNHRIDIPENKAVYMIVRTMPDEALTGNYSKTFKNEVGVVDNTGHYDKLDEADYVYAPAKAVYKEPKLAAYYDAKENKWTPCSVTPGEHRTTDALLKQHFDPNGMTSSKGSGLYMEWLINVNWDGTLEGDYILTDHLDKNKYEPVILRTFWGKHPGHKTIPELDADNNWDYSDTGDIPFYYNKNTGEIKIRVSDLKNTNRYDDPNALSNMQLICRVIDPDIIFTGTNTTIPNSFSLDKTDGTHITDGIVYHQIKPAYLIDKKQSGVGDSVDENKNTIHHTNKLNYEININPNKEDFIVNSDILPDLIDEMSNSMELIGDIEIYDDEKNPIKNIPYTLVKGDTTTKITISNLPDNKHIIIKYSTRVNTSPEVPAEIYNYAYWKGYSRPDTPQRYENFSFNLMGNVSAQSNPQIAIKKVDRYNSNIALGDAKFEIRKVETNGTINDTTLLTLTTDKDGMININSTLEYNTVYQLKETKAPTEYVIDDTPHYFMVITNDKHGYPITDGKMTIDDKEEQVIVDYAANEGIELTMTITNSKGKIKINKTFQNENGGEIDPPENGSFNFGLYYDDPAVKNTARLVQILTIVYKNGNVTYLLDGNEVNSPEFTKARAGYENYVYELDGNNQPVTGNDHSYINGRMYDVFYNQIKVFIPIKSTNNSEIIITNKEYNIYLPVTGGKGILWYYKNALRVLMICLTAAVIVIFLKKRRKQA